MLRLKKKRATYRAYPGSVPLRAALSMETTYRTLIKPYHHTLRAVVRSYGTGIRDPENTIAQIELRILQNRNAINYSANVKSWIITLANRLCINEIRKRQVEKKHRKRIIETHAKKWAPAPTPLEITQHREAIRRKWQTILSRLNADDTKLVRLVFEKAVPYKEAAAELGIPIGTIKSRVHRLRPLLAEHLTEMPDLKK